MNDGIARRTKRFYSDVPPHIPSDRCTGRSLGIALEAIGKSLQNPGVTYKIKDHFGTYSSDRNTLKLAQLAVEKLDLKFLVFRSADNSIMYDLFLRKEPTPPKTVNVNGYNYKLEE